MCLCGFITTAQICAIMPYSVVFLKLRIMFLNQCFLEESRQLMRLPPRQSTAEADLIVPFQLVSDNLFFAAEVLLIHNLILSH
jgi:hypothetical protein